MKKIRSLIAIIIFAFGLVSVCQAAVRLPDVLSSGMVLQRNSVVPIWGKALPGEKITVIFNGQEKSTMANNKGKWKVYLDTMKANSHPQEMTIQGINTIHLKDILIGEVWLCAGQSNMQLTLNRTNNGDSVIRSAHYPLLRLFNVDRHVAFKHKYGPLAKWKKCSPESVRPFSAAAYYLGLELQKELNVPIGIINSSFGGSQAEAWIPQSFLHTPELQPCIDREEIWQKQRSKVQKKYALELKQWDEQAKEERAAGRKPKSGRPHQPEALREYRVAGSIYKNMIAPLMPFAIKGAFWYQGESNEGRAEQYTYLLPALIRSWRAFWGEGLFPFGIVQLPNYRDVESHPVDQAWSHLRDAQRVTAKKFPNTGLIVTIDIGEAHNIHPHNKLGVGKRMSRWALSSVYHKRLLPGGPVFRKVELKGNKMLVSFDATGTGLITADGKAPQEFAVAGKDHQWYWAKAKIIDKNKVIVWSNKVKHPVAVRYAFNDNPKNPNLTNQSSVPASPFRSDDWKGPTHGKR